MTDPLTLETNGVSLHQLATFLKEARSLAEAVKQSPLFAITGRGEALRAEWVATGPEEVLPYPIGRVTLHARGILLEGFSEPRVAELRRQVDQLGTLRLTADETRAFRLEDLLANPEHAMHPLEDATGAQPTAREVARWYLRAGWPYQPCPELDGRTPAAAIGTGRGRKRIEALLEELGTTLMRRIPNFPSFDEEELRALLLEKPKVTSPADAGTERAARRAARQSPRRA